jgi:uncharacterized protein YaaN involved in tellurite resistance
MSANQEQTNQANAAMTLLKKASLSPEERAEKLKRLEDLPVIDKPVENLSEEQQRAAAVVAKMFSTDMTNEFVQEGLLVGLKDINDTTMQKAKDFTSQKLDARMGELKSGGAEGNEVFDHMMGLNDELKNIHPDNFDLTENFITKILPFLSPVRKYFTQFASTKSVIDNMKAKLEKSIEDQRVDIKILKQDKRALAGISIEIKKAIAFSEYLLEEVKARVEQETDEAVVEFLEAQVQFNITRDIQGLQELLTVNMQGQQSFEMLVRTGTDLIDSAERCVNISVNAVTIAAVVAHVVAGQKKMLDGINAVNQTASNMIQSNAKMMNTTIKDISKAAVETNLDVDMLVNAINMSVEAIQEDIQYRRDSLPAMEERVNKLSAATKVAEEHTQKLEKARVVKEKYDENAASIFTV